MCYAEILRLLPSKFPIVREECFHTETEENRIFPLFFQFLRRRIFDTKNISRRDIKTMNLFAELLLIQQFSIQNVIYHVSIQSRESFSLVF